MRVIHQKTAKRMMRSAALLAVAAAAAGCSSNASRFSDDFYTGSVSKVRPPAAVSNQPFPSRNSASNTPVYTGSTPQQVAAGPAVSTGRVERGELPVARTQPIAGGEVRQAAAPLLAPVVEKRERVTRDAETLASAPQKPSHAVDTMTTGGVAPKPETVVAAAKPAAELAPPAAQATPAKTEGWSKTGGTYVQIGSGETIYNLSRRFGVPANAIMEANNISDPASVQAGQKLLIPTYVYSRTAPVSAPDADPKTASAKASTGTKYDIPANKVPVPGKAPSRDVAVLPAGTATRSRDSGESVAVTPKQKTADTTRTAAASPPATGTYVVEKGDTLYGIAKKTGVPVTTLKAANGLDNGLLQIGQKLALAPGATPANVDPIVTGTAAGSAKTKPVKTGKLPQYTPPKVDEAILAKVEKTAAEKAPAATGIGKMRWPANGRVITGYGARSAAGTNDGIDIALPQGTPVKAAENGVVIYAGEGLKEFGKTVLVRHKDGLVSVYGHNGELNVRRGDTVKRGQQIARSGMSGNADTPKLHFEVRKNSKPVDPTQFLN